MHNSWQSIFLAVPLFLSLSLSGAPPADITGVVIDPSGRPIAGAVVTCGGKPAVTGLEGDFAFPGVERCEATFQAPGFETKKLRLASGAEVRIPLAVAGVTERVVVTATRHETTVEEAGVAASIITRGELEQRQFPMALDFLREIPGLHVTKYGRNGGLTEVFTRGAPRTGTLVLIDGVPLNDPGGEVNLAHLTSASIDRLEIVRSPESTLFGAEASAGVIQLFTRRGDAERKAPHGTLSYDRGSFQTDHWMADLSGGSGERFDYSLVSEQFHTVSEFPNDFYRNTSGSANLGLRISPATQVRGIFKSFDSMLGVPNQVGYRIFDFDANEADRESVLALRLQDARGRRYLQAVSFDYHRLRDVYTDSRLDGPYQVAALLRELRSPAPRVYLVELVDPERPPLIPPGTRLATRDVTLYPLDEPFVTVVSRKKFDYQGTFQHRDGVAVFGYDYERQEGNISGRDVHRDNHGLFVHKQQTLAGRIFLSGGVRFEHSSVFGRKLAPRAAASFLLFREHGPLSSTFFRLSAGRGIREPSLLENFARESFFVGNPALRPEKTTSYEAGLVQEWFGRRLRTEASAFHSSFQDLIVFVFPADVGTWQNVEASRARGLEFAGRAKFARYFTAQAGYTRLWTRITRSTSPSSIFTGVGQELARRPRNAGSVSLAAASRRWLFQAGAVFMGERQDFDLFGVNRNPGYQNVYAGASFQASSHAAPFVRIENVLNSRYQEVLGYSNLARSIRGGLRLTW